MSNAAPTTLTPYGAFRRYNTKPCGQPGCGVVTSVVAAPTRESSAFFVTEQGARLPASKVDSYHIALACRGCGRVLRARPVLGKVNVRVKCDARCTHAKGHSCECACGGKNHGAGNEAVEVAA